jgi:hypothetical protein
MVNIYLQKVQNTNSMNKLFAGLLLIFSGSVLAQRNLDSLTKLRVKSNPMKNIRTDAYRKKFDFDNARYFLENEHSQRVSRTPLAIAGMDGYDFAPIVANNKTNGLLTAGNKNISVSRAIGMSGKTATQRIF